MLAGVTAPVTLCVLVWGHEGRHDDLAAYEDEVLALLPEHGGELRQRLRSTTPGEGPYEVHVLWLPSQEALEAFAADPRRQRLAQQRVESMAHFEVIHVEPV